MALQFTRNAKVYVELLDAVGGSNVQTWKLGVLDGLSFSQAINASEITISEAGTTSRRARLLFNDNLAPVEWSFSTYVRPFIDNAPNVTRAPEDALWAMMLGADSYVAGTGIFSNAALSPDVPVNATGSNTNTFNFNGSNVSALSDFWNIYISFEEAGNEQIYKLTKAAVNSVTLDFDIEGIATLQWSGFAATVEDAGPSKAGVAALTSPEESGLTDTSNFIRNRISTVSLTRTDVSPDDVYNIVLTGGSFTIENNLSYLTPEELGVVNVPLANVTGARAVTGSLTCYLDNDAGNSKSGELFADLVSDTTTVRNVFNMAINVGGDVTGTPHLIFALPTAHLEVPTINVEDLLTLEVNFHGQVSSGNVDNTDEATIIYGT